MLAFLKLQGVEARRISNVEIALACRTFRGLSSNKVLEDGKGLAKRCLSRFIIRAVQVLKARKRLQGAIFYKQCVKFGSRIVRHIVSLRLQFPQTPHAICGCWQVAILRPLNDRIVDRFPARESVSIGA